jgi:hypothetical protein
MRRHNHLSTYLESTIGSADSFGKAHRCKGICARYYDEVWIAARLKSGTDLVKPRLGINGVLSAHVVVKPLGINLVLQVNAGGSGMFNHPYGMSNMRGLSEPRPDINYYHGGDGARGYGHVFRALIRVHITSRVTKGTTGQVKASKSDPLGNPGSNGIVDPRRRYHSRAVYHLA